MKMKTVIMVSVLALAAAVPTMAQRSQVAQVPVAGECDAAAGGVIAYDGILNNVWTPRADGSGWNVTSILVAEAWVKGTGARFDLFGVSEQRVAGSAGAVVELDGALVAAGIGGSGMSGILRFGAELPRMAAVPSARAVALAASREAPEPVAIPVKGQYYEPAVAGQVSYEGLVTLFWTPPQSGAADWTLSGTLAADAVAAGTGARYVCFGFCKDCFVMAPDSTVEMTKPVYAIGVGHAGGFQLTASMTLVLPRGAAFPTVSSVSLASK